MKVVIPSTTAGEKIEIVFDSDPTAASWWTSWSTPRQCRVVTLRNGIQTTFPLQKEMLPGRYTLETEFLASGVNVFVYPMGAGRDYGNACESNQLTGFQPASIRLEANQDELFVTNIETSLPSSASSRQVYFDAMGREMQTQLRNSEKLIVLASGYDISGRKSIQAKPIEYTTPNDDFKPSTLWESASWQFGTAMQTSDVCATYSGSDGYSNDGGYPYTLSEHFADPLGRVKHVHAPGATFMNENSGRYISYVYGKNSTSDNSTYGLSAPTGTLFKTTTTDENGNSTIKFNDVLERTVASIVDNKKTSFEFDGAGRMTKVTRPQGDATTYAYDTRGLLAEKTSPDDGTTTYVYDQNGNARLVRDANHSTWVEAYSGTIGFRINNGTYA